MIFLIVGSFFFVQFHQNVHVHACEIANDCPNVTSPEQIRVALRSTNTITISWRTSWMPNGTNGTFVPRVKYGLSSDLEHGIIANGTSGTYTKVGIISWFHDVVITVNYSRTYYYQILESLCVNNSTLHSFTSQPAPDDLSPTNISIVGDIGYDTPGNHNAANNTIKGLLNVSNYTNLFLHVGDMSYADDATLNVTEDLNGEYYEDRWNKFQASMEALTAENIYMTAPGNHEVTCIQLYDCYCELLNTSGLLGQYRNFSAYLNRFSMPGGDSDHTFKNLWYSFDYGLAHIVIINTETDFEGAPAGPSTSLNGGNFRSDNTQVAWLEDDLQRAKNRKDKVPWIIVVGHRPWYGSVPSYISAHQIKSDNCPTCQDAFAEILFKNSVDFYFSGHVHWYERLWPVDLNGHPLALNYSDPQGPIYITTGAGGAPEGAQSMGVQVNASAFYQPTYGFSHLQLINSLVAQLYFYNSSNMVLLDNVTITRSTPPQTSCSH